MGYDSGESNIKYQALFFFFFFFVELKHREKEGTREEPTFNEGECVCSWYLCAGYGFEAEESLQGLKIKLGFFVF